MKRIFALLTGAAIALGWLAIAPDANAHGRYFGRYGYYYGDPSFGYYGGPSFGRSPMYTLIRKAPAPDQKVPNVRDCVHIQFPSCGDSPLPGLDK